MKLYTATAMREVDRIAIEEMGVPSLSLMENAAQAVAGALARTVPEKLAGRVVILCGKGNNGGDGMAVARLLAGMGYSPTAWLAVPPEVLSGDARVQFDSLGPAMVSWRSAAESPDELKDALSTADLVVDALLGTGLGGPVRAPYLELVRAVNESPAFVAAVDIPSGMAGDSLQPIGEAVRANLTLTLALPKPCLYIREGAAFAGTVQVLDIGIPPEAAARVEPVAEALDDAWARPFFGPREAGTHKGKAGRVLLVAGSVGKSGAAALAARGALRAGAGLVTVACPVSAQPVVAASLPEVMTIPLPETREGTVSMDALMPILEACATADAVGMGPGLGDVPEALALCRELYRRITRPAVVDADALNAFAGRADELRDRGDARILTPHPGEMGRLVGRTASEVVSKRFDLAPEKAEAWGTVVLLKGYRTLVASAGRAWRLNLSGGPHMAGPGFGDVLTGVAAAILARGVEPFDAAALAAWWHGAAADAAYQALGGYGLLASECADGLPLVEGTLRAGAPHGPRP